MEQNCELFNQFHQDFDAQCNNPQKICYQWENKMEKRITNYLNELQIDVMSPTRKKTNYFCSQKSNILQIGRKTVQSQTQPPCKELKLIKLNQCGISESKIWKKRQQAKDIDNNK